MIQPFMGCSSHFVWLNRSKESLTLDLKQDGSKMVLDKLLSKADVFIQNLAPGAVDRLGFSSSVLKKKYPQLVICGISGYGTFGPYMDKKAYDLLIQCEGGSRFPYSNRRYAIESRHIDCRYRCRYVCVLWNINCTYFPF